MGTLHRLLGILAVCRTRTALVKSHDDVRTNLALDIHHTLGGEHQFAAVDMRGELHTLLGHLADIGQREHLKTTRIRQYRTFPTLETVQTTCLVQDLRTRTQVEMVGVAEDDLSIDILLQKGALHTLHRPYRTHRHKDRSLDIPMIGMYHTRACARVRIRMYKVEKCH